MHRDLRQNSLFLLGKELFGESNMTDTKMRALRMLEEAIELYQSCGCEAEQAKKLIDYVFSREPGGLFQEIGGLGVTVLALAESCGFSADDAEIAEIQRLRSKPKEHFAKRNQHKIDLGFKP